LTPVQIWILETKHYTNDILTYQDSGRFFCMEAVSGVMVEPFETL